MTAAPDARPANDESALIRRVLAGDEAAFRHMYRAHSQALYRLALRLSGGREASAHDVMQETWSRAIRLLAGFEQRSSLATWLSSIVIRCALERIRWEQRNGVTLPDGGAARAYDSAEERVDLARAFEALPPGYRSVLILHDVEGYPHDRIAALLDISPGTSKSQLARARAWMRRALGPDYVSE
jgi:RNA polymerase sigma factor (sigma-70 family)